MPRKSTTKTRVIESTVCRCATTTGRPPSRASIAGVLHMAFWVAILRQRTTATSVMGAFYRAEQQEISCASTEAQDLGTSSPTKTRAGQMIDGSILRLLSFPGLGIPSDKPAPKRSSSAGTLQGPIRRQTRDFGFSTICRILRSKQSAFSCWPLSMYQSQAPSTFAASRDPELVRKIMTCLVNRVALRARE
jgi:hypothetical protein